MKKDMKSIKSTLLNPENRLPVWIGALCTALVLSGAAYSVVRISSRPEASAKENSPVVYIKENTLTVKPLSKKAYPVSDYLTASPEEISPVVVLSETGDTIYFLESYRTDTQTGSLYASFEQKEKFPVSNYAYKKLELTDNGSSILFAEPSNSQPSTGDLFFYHKGEEKKRIAGGVQTDHFMFGQDNKHFMYLEAGNDLYLQSSSSQREKIDSDVSKPLYLTQGQNAYYTKKAEDGSDSLYYCEKGKAPKKISDRFSGVDYIFSKENEGAYFTRNDEDSKVSLHYTGKKGSSSEVDPEVISIVQADPKNKKILYSKNNNPETGLAELYYQSGSKSPVKLADGIDAANPLVQVSDDFKTVSYISQADGAGSGDLYLCSIGYKGPDTPVLVAKQVSKLSLSKDGNILAYTAATAPETQTRLFVYQAKKITQISENVDKSNFDLSGDGKHIAYLNSFNNDKNSGNLFIQNLADLNKEPVKIASDVNREFYLRNGGKVLYTTGTTSKQFFLWKGKKSEIIDQGQISILFEK